MMDAHVAFLSLIVLLALLFIGMMAYIATDDDDAY